MLKAARWIVLGLLAVSVLSLTFALGYVFRGDDGGQPLPAVNSGNGSAAEKPATEGDFDNLNQIMKLLQDKYVDPDLIDRQTLYQSAITGMLQTLPDSGTFYVDPNTVRTSVGPSGKFEGIGATVASQNGQIIIVAPIENTPAERAGLRAGDAILEVDGESTEGWSQEKAVLRIRGQAGTKVTLKIRHTDNQEETLEIERDEIKVQSVTSLPPGGALKDGSGADISDLGYIHIREFNEQTLEELQASLRDVVSSGKRGLILDLRNNPGGLLNATAQVADEFLDGDKLILTERERDGTESQFKSHAGGVAVQVPVVILLNRFSASGSEVLAAALHDNGRATLVGEKSFGKGTVNVSSELKDGGQLYVSIAKWLTPNGTQIDGVGIRPDIEVQLSDDDIDARRDVQLFKAIDVLRGTDTTPASALTPVPAQTDTVEGTPTRTGG
ncbi:MAG: S41 family peptidase [Chloroflexi bacterium]|nr:S41 family peptidase [Chloroflexota bacterium]